MNNQPTTAPNAPVIILTSGRTANGLAVAAFVCGILGILSTVFGFAPGFLGYAFYLDARRRGCTHGLMTAAKVLCIISIAVSAVSACFLFACFGSMMASVALLG